MKNQSLKEEFIRLRALGVSYDKIAQTIHISKPTLLKWAQECTDQIANELYLNVDSLLDQYRVIKTSRIEAFACCLKKAMEELSKRDFSSLPTKELLSVALLLESKLRVEMDAIKYLPDRGGLSRELFDDNFPVSY